MDNQISANTASSESLPDMEKAKTHVLIETIAYIPNTIISKTILKKATGNITLLSFEAADEMTDRTFPSDTFIQVIDGAAEIMINKKVHHLHLGHGFIVPAHSLHRIDASEPFKMISTVIKSGFES